MKLITIFSRLTPTRVSLKANRSWFYEPVEPNSLRSYSPQLVLRTSAPKLETAPQFLARLSWTNVHLSRTPPPPAP